MIAPPEDQRSSVYSQAVNQPKHISLVLESEFLLRNIEEETSRLNVKYFVKSKAFPKFIKAGIGIEEDNLIYKSWSGGERIQGMIPASLFGSSAPFAYHAECLPLGRTGKVLVLLWIPDDRLRLDL